MNHFARFASLLAALFFSLGAVADPIPVPDPVFNFTFSIGPNTGFGSLNTVDNGGGSFHAIGGSLTVTGGLDIGTYSLGTGGPTDTHQPNGCVHL